MGKKIDIIGIYQIPNNADVHLIELEIDEKPSLIRVGEFTQAVPNSPREDWQAACDECYLNSIGDKIIGDYFRLPENDEAPTKLAFFLFYKL